MNTKYKQLQQAAEQRGFTIIEVVLVLAIAGLIFLMVFLALPALQKGQRDTQRREDLSRISTQLNSYSSNSRGKIPASANDLEVFVEKYLGGASGTSAGSEYMDPSGNDNDPNAGYTVTYVDSSFEVPEGTGTVYYTDGVICGDNGTVTSGKARNYAMRIGLENQKAAYCIDNR